VRTLREVGFKLGRMLEVKAEVDSKKHSDDIRGVLTALPQLEHQRAEHRWFVERLVEITAGDASADAAFKHDLFEHLKGWFANHILVQDMMLRSFTDQEKAEPS
jgi:hypothetical protein